MATHRIAVKRTGFLFTKLRVAILRSSQSASRLAVVLLLLSCCISCESRRNAASNTSHAGEVPQQIQDLADKEVVPLAADRPSVERYLALLARRARDQHHVTALEVEPGLKAIARLHGTQWSADSGALRDQFLHSMAELSAELRAARASP
jgi:hypothetical protein